jgi:hypothetical protein
MLGGGLLLLSHWTGAEPIGPMQPLPLPTGPVLGSRKLYSELAADCGQMTANSKVIYLGANAHLGNGKAGRLLPRAGRGGDGDGKETRGVGLNS